MRKGRGGETIISNKPTFSPDRTFNSNQVAAQDAFRMAIAYAKTARNQDVYVLKSQGTSKTAFNVAVADWFNEPEVLALDLSGWTKDANQTIRVQAQDDTYVASVHVVIRDENNVILEEGDAVRSDGLWWTYTTLQHVAQPGIHTVIAQAFDLAGNKDELTLGK